MEKITQEQAIKIAKWLAPYRKEKSIAGYGGYLLQESDLKIPKKLSIAIIKKGGIWIYLRRTLRVVDKNIVRAWKKNIFAN